MERLTSTHRRRRKAILAAGDVKTVIMELEVEGIPPLLLPATAQVWAIQGRHAPPSWKRVCELTKPCYVAAPIDPPNRDETSLRAATIAYIAGSMLADGITSATASSASSVSPACPLPEVLMMPGVGHTMLANAVSLGLVETAEGGTYAGAEITQFLESMIQGSDTILDVGSEAKTAICRAWMDGTAPHTTSKPAALLMSRILRSTLRQNPSIRRLSTGQGWLYTLDASLRGMRLEGGMAWLKFVSCRKVGVAVHQWVQIQDDDSRVVDGLYLRDSMLNGVQSNMRS